MTPDLKAPASGDERAVNRKSSLARSGTILGLQIISIIVLSALVAGFIWRDLKSAYQQNLAQWDSRLIISVNEHAELAAMWLREQWANGHEIASNPATRRLILARESSRKSQNAVAENLDKSVRAHRLLGEFLLNRQCKVLARAGRAKAEDENFQLDCRTVQKSASPEVLAFVQSGSLRDDIIVPVYGAASAVKLKKRPIIGFVVLVANPVISMLTYFPAQHSFPLRTETLIAWVQSDGSAFAVSRDLANGENLLAGKAMNDSSFEGRAARMGNLPFGEYQDYRGVRILGIAKRIAVFPDAKDNFSVASRITWSAAMSSFKRRATLESEVGGLLILVIGLVIVALTRRARLQELHEELRQSEAIIDLQRQARASEARYEELFENAHDAIVAYDREGRFTGVNRAAEELVGYTKQELLGMNIAQVIAPECLDAFRQSLQNILNGESMPPQETNIVAKDGKRIRVEASRQPIFRDGAVVGIQVIARDINERKRAEEKLAHKERELEEAQRLAQVGSWEWTAATGDMTWSSELMRLAGRDPGLPAPSYADLQKFFPEAMDQLKSAVGGMPKPDASYEVEMELPTLDGGKAWCVARGEPIRDATGKIIGRRGTVQDISRIKKAEVALSESEERLRKLSEASFEGIAFTDSDKIVLANQRLAEMTGCKLEELIGSNVQQWIAPESLETVMERLQTGSETPYEFLLKRTDGTTIPIESRARYMMWKNKQVRVAAMRDISDRKRSEAALLESEERFRRLSEATFEGVVFSDAGRIVLANSRLSEMLGATVEELAGTQITDWIAPESRDVVMEHIRSGSEGLCEHLNRRKDGTTFHAESRARYLPWKGRIVRVTAIRDISDRKRAEEVLRALTEGTASVTGSDFFASLVRHSAEALHAKIAFVAELTGPGRARTLANWREGKLHRNVTYDLKDTPCEEVIRGNTSFYPQNVAARFPKDLHLMKADIESYLGVPLFDANMKVIGHLAVMDDKAMLHDSHAVPTIEIFADRAGAELERLRASEELEKEKAFSDAVVDSMPGFLYVADDEGKVIRWNQRAETMLGYKREELSSKEKLEEIVDHGDHGKPWNEAGGNGAREVEVMTKDGRQLPVLLSTVRAGIGDARYVIGTGIDITEWQAAERALRASQETFSKAFHTSPEPMAILTLPDWKFLDVNKAACDLTGYAREEIIGNSAKELGATMLTAAEKERYWWFQQGEFRDREFEFRLRTGEARSVLLSLELVDIAGRPCVLAQARDITEYRRATNALKESDQRYRDFISHSAEGVWRIEFGHPIPLNLPEDQIVEKILAQGYLAECNDAVARIHGFADRSELTGMRARDLWPSDDTQYLESIRTGVATGFKNRTIEFQTLDRQGAVKYLQRTEIPIVEDGALVRAWGMTRDVTEMRRAEEALYDSEERYRLLFERSLAGVVRMSSDGKVLESNDAFARILGYESRQEILQSNIRDLYLEKNDGTALLDLLADQPSVMGDEFQTRRKDGSPAWLMVSATLEQSGGKDASILATAVDITQWKELGEQLRQSQKMEAVGRLAGGVAHDFNNMLQIINGYSELVIDDLPEQDPRRTSVQEIKNVVERAAGLTRQLLAFSRQQVLAPQVMDLNVAVANVSKMLRRLIGEDVELVIQEGHPLSRVKADPGQIDQVLLNLVVNARDAMPGGGKLTIQTSNTIVDAAYSLAHYPMTPGPYVMLAVNDTGSGMSAETQARIFEPFFTTKEKGKGTGLGLATVYGIIKQSEGFIWVESEIGKGSKFKIFLPPADAVALTEEIVSAPTVEEGSETVLLVEDEDYVRSLVRRFLKARGYSVLEASNARDALRVAQEFHGPIHLLITDVVMPGMSGPELCERLSSLRPDTKTLYMTGYADLSILHRYNFQSDSLLLQKPFTADALASKVRQVLTHS